MILAITPNEVMIITYYKKKNEVVTEAYRGTNIGWCRAYRYLDSEGLNGIRAWHKRWGDEILHDDGDY